MTLVLFLAIFTKSLPLLCENSTAQTQPVGPTISDTWDTVVPEAPPKYKTLKPGLIQVSEIPPIIEAAILERYGFHTLYSVFSPPGRSTLTLFSLYTLSPG